MLHELLRTKTHSEHEAIEGIVDFEGVTSSSERYLKLLRTFYGFYIPVEDALTHFDREFESLGLSLKPRMKQKLLQEDLKLMNGEKGIQFCENCPPMGSVYEALGVLYVLEGSTLGGQFIYKQLLVKNDFNKKEELKFHAGYGKETGPMWASFKNILSSIPDAHHEEVVNSANKTFQSLRNWLTHCS